MIELIDVTNNQKQISRDILESLKDWFIPMVVDRVVKEADQVPMIAARDGDKLVALITLKQQTSETVEIRALAVRPEYHRKGIGRLLVAEAEQRAIQDGARMLSLKTVGPSDSNPNFVPTRAFYSSLGFIHVEELPLWGPETSCLLMAKPLAS